MPVVVLMVLAVLLAAALPSFRRLAASDATLAEPVLVVLAPGASIGVAMLLLPGDALEQLGVSLLAGALVVAAVVAGVCGPVAVRGGGHAGTRGDALPARLRW